MNEPDYEALKRQLIERGYLGGQLERFMLRDVLASRSTVGRILLPPFRAGLIGGPVVGAVLALLVASTNRPALGPADAPLLWAYFCLPAILAVMLVEGVVAALMTGLAAWRGARPGDALRAGLLVAIPLLGYLSWLRWAGGPGDGPTRWDLLLALIAAAAILLVSWLAGLVSVAGIVGRTGEVPARRRRVARVVVLLLLVSALAAWLVRARSGSSQEPERPVQLAVESVGPSLLLIGVDGFGSELLHALEPRGVADDLLARMEQSSVFPVSRRRGGSPPEIWTTLVTGQPASRHGVTSIGRERVPGLDVSLGGRRESLALDAALRYLLPSRTVPTSGAVRQARTLWEIVALARPVSAVGWWTSWPAVLDEPDGNGGGGYLVSDRVLSKLLTGAGPDRDTHPGSLFDRLAESFDADRRQLREQFGETIASSGESRLDGWLWESYLIDAYALKVERRLAADPAVRARFVYLPGLDILRSRLQGAVAAETDLAVRSRAQQALEAYVGWISTAIAEELDRSVAEGVGILLADPGREASPESEGFVLVGGPADSRACIGGPIGPLEVAPLVLDRIGFPASLEMPGRTPTACRDAGERPAARIPSYGAPRSAREPAASSYDPEMVERLRSLGYLN